MKKVTRYLFLETFLLVLGITLVITGAMWLTQSLRFIDYVMNRGLSFLSFLELSGYLVPGLLSPILPIACFIGTMFTFNRLYNDRELTVLKAAGLSNNQIMQPFIWCGAIVFLMCLILNLEYMPAAKRAFKDKREEIRNNMSGQWLQPGQFMTFNQVSFYTREKNRAGAMRGILIYDARNRQEPVTIVAELGQVSETDHGLRFEIFNGSRQTIERKTRKPQVVYFDNYSVEVQNPKYEERDLRLNEMSLAQLLTNRSVSLDDHNARHHEMHERILIPMLVFVFIFLAGIAFLKSEFNRRGITQRIVMTSLLCIFLQIMTLGVMNAWHFTYSIAIAYGIITLTLVLSGHFLLLDIKRVSPQLTVKKD